MAPRRAEESRVEASMRLATLSEAMCGRLCARILPALHDLLLSVQMRFGFFVSTTAINDHDWMAATIWTAATVSTVAVATVSMKRLYTLYNDGTIDQATVTANEHNRFPTGGTCGVNHFCGSAGGSLLHSFIGLFSSTGSTMIEAGAFSRAPLPAWEAWSSTEPPANLPPGR